MEKIRPKQPKRTKILKKDRTFIQKLFNIKKKRVKNDK